ncbi:hypothetical protein BDZ85DRAFT_257797 [Elsinoe ampelina]|uniref:Secreted protein n=1 Tax=Elsinoe ampelina TaxID=302913 RepID=A0A6A6GIP5_9PEZI|nr:hypothetical protein BDZ85DRAFT_257797 [Elsinoe ampelina]
MEWMLRLLTRVLIGISMRNASGVIMHLSSTAIIHHTVSPPSPPRIPLQTLQLHLHQLPSVYTPASSLPSLHIQ